MVDGRPAVEGAVTWTAGGGWQLLFASQADVPRPGHVGGGTRPELSVHLRPGPNPAGLHQSTDSHLRKQVSPVPV
jgi:hypothetical protein